MGVLTLIRHKRLSAGSSPHQPDRLTWIVSSTLTGGQGNLRPPPFHLVAPLTFDLCDLAAGLDIWDIPNQEVKGGLPECHGKTSCSPMPCPGEGLGGRGIGC